MSATTTVLVPVEQIDAIRESLLATHRELAEEIARLESRVRAGAGSEPAPLRARARLDALEQVLGQVGWTGEQVFTAREVTGQKHVLWSAAYDIVCIAAERLAEICTAYWLGSVAPTEIHAGLADLEARFELLESLGPLKEIG
jgi:hypothetical protein